MSAGILSNIQLRGNGHERDSFALTVQAVLRLFERPTDYLTLAALSTNVFAPAVRTGETCKAWWHMYGGEKGLDIVADRFGLCARPLDLPRCESPFPDGGQAAELRRRAVPLIREATGCSEVVIAPGGWVAWPEEGRLVPWCWWGVIVEARDDGTILGACLNGRTDNPVNLLDGCWGLSPEERPRRTPYESDLAMLRHAIQRVRGEGRFLERDGLLYGLAAMDAWAARLKEVPFCPDCEDRSRNCARANAITFVEGCRTVAAYLHERAPGFGEEASRHLEAAAGHYVHAARLLRPALTGEGGPSYRDIMGDPATQAAHVKTILECRDELAHAADEMDRAIRAAA